jgi:hypothetical protein
MLSVKLADAVDG